MPGKTTVSSRGISRSELTDINFPMYLPREVSVDRDHVTLKVRVGCARAAEIASVAELIALRGGDAMELNDRFLNPQLGRIVRTLGFDHEWAHGEGAT